MMCFENTHEARREAVPEWCGSCDAAAVVESAVRSPEVVVSKAAASDE